MNIALVKIAPNGPRGSPVCVDLGLAYLLKAAEAAGHKCDIVDGVIRPVTPGEVVRRFGGAGPWLLGVKVFSHQIGAVRRFAAGVKDLDSQARVVVGGPHASGMAEATLASIPEADYAMVGEGEIGLPRLADALASERPAVATLANVPGLVFRKGDSMAANAPEFSADLDALGAAPWARVGLPEYLRFKTPVRNAPLTPILTSRGCPFPCSYCAGHRITGRKIRRRTPRLVVEEIARLKRDFGVGAFSTQDDNFTMFPEHVRGFCEELLRQELTLRWDCLSSGVRVDRLTEELVVLMERSGCRAVSVAVESGNQAVLDDMRKQSSLDVAARQIRMIKRCSRIVVNTYYILGYPTETKETLRNTMRFARRSGADYAQFFLFTPLPGTEIADRLREQGRLGAADWETFAFDAPTLPLADVSVRGLKRTQMFAYFSFYLRPRQLWRLLRNGGDWAQWRDLFQRFLSLLDIGRRQPRSAERLDRL